MQVRRRLTEFESTIAMLAGAGLIVLMLAFLLASARGSTQALAPIVNVPITTLMALGGALLLVGSLVAWLVVSRPWTTAHDDWATPLYTGHHGEHPTAGAHPATHGEAIAAEAEVVAEPFAHGEIEVSVQAHPAAAEVIAATPATSPTDEAALAAIRAAEAGDVLVEGELPPNAPLALAPQVVPSDTVPADAIVTDDLTIVEGIGPKIAAALAAAGINTYAKLAAQEPSELERIVRAAGVRMVGKAITWPEQAHLLAEGRLEEWKALAARLKSGH